ncbi:MAG: response regulator [Candidatus Nitrosopolaris sp.]
MTTETTKDSDKKKKLLIVDDEPDVNTVLKKVFEQSGFNADSYDDPILALENFKAGSYDLLLLDVVLPYIGDNIAYQHGLHFCQEVYSYRNQNKV